MQRRTLVAAVLIVALLVLAGTWFGFGGAKGLTLVHPESPQADSIADLYLFIGAFAVAIFLSVTIPLALIIARYRERGLPREVEGPQVRGNTQLELAWTGASILIVLVIVGFTLYKANGINDPEPAQAAGSPGRVAITVEGRQYYWRYVYANQAISIDTLRLPLGRVADLTVVTPLNDVIHSFWVPALGGKIDAIPGVTNHLRIRPDKVGVYDGRCAELCGIQHAAMQLQVEVMPPEQFDAWLAEQGRAQTELGQEIFTGVCSKCHFAAPEYAPNILGNPTLGDPVRLAELVQHGRGRMPAVGQGWTERELDALTAYTKTLPGGGG